MFRQVPWRKVLAWSGLLAAAVVVVVAAVYVIFWPVSDLIARHDVGAVTGRSYGAALQAARDAARGRLAAFGVGLFAAGALIYTARNFSLARQGQVTDRYTKAIEQLGSSKELDVRIGGIYALERIARDSARDQPTVMEVLAAFIRGHSSEQWPPAGPGVAPGAVRPERATRPDVQAAVTVIGRRNPRHDRQTVDLRSVVLTGATLTGADLTGADLTGADLTGADLTGADLTRADLTGAKLTGAKLTDAKLAGAQLTRAVLAGAKLTRADLTRAELLGAELLGADLAAANLTLASLIHADLTGADLTYADLTGVSFISANLTHADLTYAHLAAARLSLIGAHTTGAPRSLHPDFTGANLSDVKWPEGVQVPDGWAVDSNSGRLRPAGRLPEVTAHYLG